ncbi:MAG TPA: 1,4-alpha-glucan branching enzyme, partial [Gammaproteobacteria bacterium]|nr:1,4-alpha-glucan branching enzyme [Gammaproteobacteria bacterium]
MTSPKLNPELQRIIEARHHDPFAVLGRHPQDKKVVVRAHLPYAQEVHIAEGNLSMERVPNTDLFEWQGKVDQIPDRYRLIWRDSDHHEHISYDPYCFPPQLPDFDLYLFGEGKHWHAYRFLGAHQHA